jgi:hypothetical protein
LDWQMDWQVAWRSTHQDPVNVLRAEHEDSFGYEAVPLPNRRGLWVSMVIGILVGAGLASLLYIFLCDPFLHWNRTSAEHLSRMLLDLCMRGCRKRGFTLIVYSYSHHQP